MLTQAEEQWVRQKMEEEELSNLRQQVLELEHDAYDLSPWNYDGNPNSSTELAEMLSERISKWTKEDLILYLKDQHHKY